MKDPDIRTKIEVAKADLARSNQYIAGSVFAGIPVTSLLLGAFALSDKFIESGDHVVLYFAIGFCSFVVIGGLWSGINLRQHSIKELDLLFSNEIASPPAQ